MKLFEELEERSQEAKQLANKMCDLGYHKAAKLYRLEAKVWLEAALIAKQHEAQNQQNNGVDNTVTGG